MSIVGRLCVESNVPLEAGSLIRFNASTKPNTITVDEQGAYAGVLLARHPGYDKLVWSGVHLEGPINVAISSDEAIIKTLDPLYITWNGECFAVTLSSDGSCLVGRSIQSCNPSLQATLAIDVRDNPEVQQTLQSSNPEVQQTSEIRNPVAQQTLQSSSTVQTERPASPPISPIEEVKVFEPLRPEKVPEGSLIGRLAGLAQNFFLGEPTDVYQAGEGINIDSVQKIVFVKVPIGKDKKLHVYNEKEPPVVPYEAIPVIINQFNEGDNTVTLSRKGTQTVSVGIDSENPPDQTPESDVFIQWSADKNHKWGRGPGGFYLGKLQSYNESYHFIVVELEESPTRLPTQDQALQGLGKANLQDISELLIEQIKANRHKTEEALAAELEAEIELIVTKNQDEWQTLSDLYRIAHFIYAFDYNATEQDIREALEHVRHTSKVRRTRIVPEEQPDPLKWRSVLEDLKRLNKNELPGYFNSLTQTEDYVVEYPFSGNSVDQKKDIATMMGVPPYVIDVAVVRGLIGNPSKTGFSKDASQAIDEAIAEELEE